MNWLLETIINAFAWMSGQPTKPGNVDAEFQGFDDERPSPPGNLIASFQGFDVPSKPGNLTAELKGFE